MYKGASPLPPALISVHVLGRQFMDHDQVWYRLALDGRLVRLLDETWFPNPMNL